jgi:hypothetical protein
MSMSEQIFIDSGIILGFFSSDKKSVDILDNLYGKFRFCISDTVFSEVVYKLMVLKFLEKEDRFKLHYMKKQLADLVALYNVVDEFIKNTDINILPTNKEVITTSVEVGMKFQLLPNDALIAATCKHYGIKKIATFDGDFKKVEFLEVVDFDKL